MNRTTPSEWPTTSPGSVGMIITSPTPSTCRNARSNSDGSRPGFSPNTLSQTITLSVQVTAFPPSSTISDLDTILDPRQRGSDLSVGSQVPVLPRQVIRCISELHEPILGHLDRHIIAAPNITSPWDDPQWDVMVRKDGLQPLEDVGNLRSRESATKTTLVSQSAIISLLDPHQPVHDPPLRHFSTDSRRNPENSEFISLPKINVDSDFPGR